MFFVIKIESNKNLKPNNEDFKIKILQFICLVNREIISEENMTLKFIFSDKLFIDIINFCSELNYLNNKTGIQSTKYKNAKRWRYVDLFYYNNNLAKYILSVNLNFLAGINPLSA